MPAAIDSDQLPSHTSKPIPPRRATAQHTLFIQCFTNPPASHQNRPLKPPSAPPLSGALTHPSLASSGSLCSEPTGCFLWHPAHFTALVPSIRSNTDQSRAVFLAMLPDRQKLQSHINARRSGSQKEGEKEHEREGGKKRERQRDSCQSTPGK